MKVRRILKSRITNIWTEPWVDPDRRVYCEGDTAFVPVRDGYSFDLDLPDCRPYTGPGYQRLGDTLLLHGNAPTVEVLANLIAWEQPACVLQLNRHAGVLRLPEVTVLHGEPHDVTFSESEIIYTLNPAKIMFSQGNRGEKQRIRSLVRSGERVADMFAGIGYFTLSAALAGADVHAMELNSDSYGYLQINAAANHVADRVHAECGDCRTLMSGIYDRILMGHFDAPEFLTAALAHAAAGTTLHVHGVGDRADAIRAAAEGAGFRYSLSEHTVKKYASHTRHCVWDVVLI